MPINFSIIAIIIGAIITNVIRLKVEFISFRCLFDLSILFSMSISWIYIFRSSSNLSVFKSFSFILSKSISIYGADSILSFLCCFSIYFEIIVIAPIIKKMVMIINDINSIFVYSSSFVNVNMSAGSQSNRLQIVSIVDIVTFLLCLSAFNERALIIFLLIASFCDIPFTSKS